MSHSIRRLSSAQLNKTLHQAKRIVIAVIGGTILLIGLALIVLPGPAFLVIPLGLGVLATEFAWARYWLKRIKALTDSFGKSQPKSQKDTSANTAPR